MADPLVVALINRMSRRYGVDPAAARAVASVEGGLRRGAVGDAGSSYGPFQLHVGGALPRGRGTAWANSPAGIEYAIRQMSRYARGKRGRASVAAIVSRFERPANIPAEIAKASARYGIGGGGLGATPMARVQAGAPPALAAALPAPPPSGLSPALAAVVASNNQLIGVPTPPLQLAPPQPPQVPRPVARASAPPRQTSLPTRGGRNVRLVRFARGADRPGVKTRPAVTRFVARIAAQVGHPLVVGTGTNHSELTVDGRVSDHWSGHAADIPATGEQLIRLGQAALIAAGMPASKARRQRGGLYNVGGHQVIFNTMEGGDHTNHLHVSAY